MSESGISRVEFVRMGALAGMVPMVSALVACGGGEQSSGGSSQASNEPTKSAAGEASTESMGGTTASGGGAIAQESEVPTGSAVKFQEGGDPAVLVHLDSGEFVAYSAVCTHKGCTVAYNAESGTLDCPCHGSVYDPSEGAAVQQGPAPRPLPEISIEVSGGEVRKA